MQGFATQAGATVPPASFAGEEAISVRRLRDAGGVIAGKTVTTEFAYFEPGPTHNPHNLAHTPGGSSSGSAAAVAAGLCPLAFGTQTIGSVIRPAAFCGVVGYKPTIHRIPSAGLVYFSRTFDHVGLFTQDVAGMALAAGALRRLGRGQPERGRYPRVGCGRWAVSAPGDARSIGGVSAPVAAAGGGGLHDLACAHAARHRRDQPVAPAAGLWRVCARTCARYAEFGPLYRPRTAEIIAQGKQVSDAELDDLRGASLVAARPAGTADAAGGHRPVGGAGCARPGAGGSARDGRPEHEPALDDGRFPGADRAGGHRVQRSAGRPATGCAKRTTTNCCWRGPRI